VNIKHSITETMQRGGSARMRELIKAARRREHCFRVIDRLCDIADRLMADARDAIDTRDVDELEDLNARAGRVIDRASELHREADDIALHQIRELGDLCLERAVSLPDPENNEEAATWHRWAAGLFAAARDAEWRLDEAPVGCGAS
jgi:phosphate uptake regulator